MAKRPELLIASGPMAGSRFEVGVCGLRLGRSSSNDVHIPDEELSRNHCLFEQVGEEGVRVIDLASANGTFVNGEQLGSEARALNVGDVIEAGSTVINVVACGSGFVVDGSGLSPHGAGPVRRGTVDLGLGGEASPA
ncbi:MAG: FHA domain-containing protein, partial [Kiritimatiellae bacterium]|nr:FHA domain-containing protein [Kiritimatiellia bacterium]